MATRQDLTFPDPDVVARYQGRELGIEEIMALLPHRPPFLLVDRILEIEPGVRAVGHKGVTINEPFFVGHFPGHPVMPGVLIVEALAQVSGLVVLTGLDPGERVPYFTGIDNARFRQAVRPGDSLRLEATMERTQMRFGRLFSRFSMQATVDGKIVADAEGGFALVEPE